VRVPSIPEALLQDDVLLHDRHKTVSVLCHVLQSLCGFCCSVYCHGNLILPVNSVSLLL